MSLRARLCTALAGACGMLWAAAADAQDSTAPVWLGRFEQTLEPWTEVRLKAELKPNRFERRLWDGVPALEAPSAGSV